LIITHRSSKLVSKARN